MTSLREAGEAWCKFWYAPEDSFTLGIVRLLTGWMLVYNLLVWGSDLQAFFGINGLQPLQTVLDLHAGTPVFSFWFYVPEPWIETAHWTCVAIAALFFMGVCTRVTSVLAFLITISYSQRVPVANFGLDQILGMLCLYLAIGPCGGSLSIDRWWKTWRAKKRGIQLPIKRYRSARLAVRLIQLHMCVIYFWAGLAKLKGDTWFTGEAMWTVLANEEYQTLDLTWLAWVPFVPYLAAHVTVIWEISFCILIWNKKLRPLLLLVGTGMHIGIGLFLGMWTFGLVMTYAYFSFSEPNAWRRRFAWITGQTTDAPIPEQSPSPRPISPPPYVMPWPTPEETAHAASLAVAPDVQPVIVAEQPTVETAVEPAPVDETPAAPTAPPSTVVARVPDIQAEAVAAESHVPEGFRRPQINTAVIRRPAIVSNGFEHGDHQSGDSMEDNEITPNTALLLITLCKKERTTLRRYFRKHDIVCRAATTTENALTLASTIKPVAILVAGTQMQSEELATLVEDLEDINNAPILALTSELQASRLATLGLSVRTMQYPMSPGEVRRTLGDLLFGTTDAAATPDQQN